mgnify:CR=1 FL=1
MSVSGHKIGAPKGIGALYVKKGLRLPPLTFGGGQERGMRPGTEAVPNIAAFAKACEIRMGVILKRITPMCRSSPTTSSSRSAPSCRTL